MTESSKKRTIRLNTNDSTKLLEEEKDSYANRVGENIFSMDSVCHCTISAAKTLLQQTADSKYGVMDNNLKEFNTTLRQALITAHEVQFPIDHRVRVGASGDDNWRIGTVIGFEINGGRFSSHLPKWIIKLDPVESVFEGPCQGEPYDGRKKTEAKPEKIVVLSPEDFVTVETGYSVVPVGDDIGAGFENRKLAEVFCNSLNEYAEQLMKELHFDSGEHMGFCGSYIEFKIVKDEN